MARRGSGTIHPLATLLAIVVAMLALAAPAHAAFPGANGKIAFHADRSGQPSGLWTMNPDGTGVAPAGQPGNHPAWSPDGQRIAFDDIPASIFEIFVMNADGTGLTQLTTSGGTNPTWSPDGTQIAFQSNRTGNNEIFTMNADGTLQIDRSLNAGIDLEPAWSPDGSKIAWHRPSSGLWTMNPDGTGKQGLGVLGQEPAWSPDSAKIAFASLDAGPDIYVVNADGTGSTQLTSGSSDNGPAWSPDGTKIAFARGGSFEPQIYTMNADGTAQTNLTNDASVNWQPDWQPLNGSYPPPPYDVPKTASPVKASLVPVFKQCGTGGNPAYSSHASPLAVNSCNPSQPFSNVARVGPASSSQTSFGVMPSNPMTPANEADVALEASLTDIQTAAGADYNPNASGPDLTAYARVRLTDTRSCTPSPCSASYNTAATTTDTFLSFPVDCVGNTEPSIGSSCNANTSANALTPGFAVEGNATVVQSFRMLVDDSGTNGVRGDGDDRIFMMQGVFVP